MELVKTENKLNQEQIKKVTDASATATATMIVLGFRERARSVTNLGRIKAQLLAMNENVIDKDYFSFWRGLEEAGAGSIVLGRRGKQTRFEWNYSLKEVAKSAIEGHEEEIEKLASKKAKVIEAPKKKRAKRKPKQTASIKQERLVFSIPVRPNYTLELNLPADTSREEFNKIKESLVYPS